MSLTKRLFSASMSSPSCSQAALSRARRLLDWPRFRAASPPWDGSAPSALSLLSLAIPALESLGISTSALYASWHSSEQNLRLPDRIGFPHSEHALGRAAFSVEGFSSLPRGCDALPADLFAWVRGVGNAPFRSLSPRVLPPSRMIVDATSSATGATARA